MSTMLQVELLSPAEELALAKPSAEGMYLSPAAQALYEKEGAERFAICHPRLVHAAPSIQDTEER